MSNEKATGTLLVTTGRAVVDNEGGTIAIDLTPTELDELLTKDDVLNIKSIVLREQSSYIQYKTEEVEYIDDDTRKVNRYGKALGFARDKALDLLSRPPATPIMTMSDARSKRNSLLKRTDWTVLPDSPLTANEKADYIEYRKQLRDLFSKYRTVESIVWPQSPNH